MMETTVIDLVATLRDDTASGASSVVKNFSKMEEAGLGLLELLQEVSGFGKISLLATLGDKASSGLGGMLALVEDLTEGFSSGLAAMVSGFVFPELAEMEVEEEKLAVASGSGEYFRDRASTEGTAGSGNTGNFSQTSSINATDSSSSSYFLQSVEDKLSSSFVERMFSAKSVEDGRFVNDFSGTGDSGASGETVSQGFSRESLVTGEVSEPERTSSQLATREMFSLSTGEVLREVVEGFASSVSEYSRVQDLGAGGSEGNSSSAVAYNEGTSISSVSSGGIWKQSSDSGTLWSGVEFGGSAGYMEESSVFSAETERESVDSKENISIFTELQRDFTKVWDTISSTVDRFAEGLAFQGAQDVVSGSGSAVMGGNSNGGTSFQSLNAVKGNHFTEISRGYLDSISKTTVEAVSGLGAVVEDYGQRLTGESLQGISTVMEEQTALLFQEKTTDLGAVVRSQMTAVALDWGDFWQGAFAVFSAEVPEAVSSLGAVVSGFFTNIKTSVSSFFSQVFSSSSTKSSAISSAGSDSSAGSGSSLSTGLSGFVSSVGSVLSTDFGDFGRVSLPEYAEGGFLNGPQIALVGEDGPEIIIPLGDKRHARGMALWQEAGRALGVSAYAQGGLVGTVGAMGDTTAMAMFSSVEERTGVQVPVSIGSVNLQVSVPEGTGASGDIVAVLKENIGELTEDLAQELSARLAMVFSNMPVLL